MKTREEVAEALGTHWPRRDDGKIHIQDCWPMVEVGDGWMDVLWWANQLAEAENPDYVLHQVKEKFGGLRFYATISRQTEAMIEGLALYICEDCGEMGGLSRTKGGWLRTLCKTHRGDKYKLQWDEWEDEHEGPTGQSG